MKRSATLSILAVATALAIAILTAGPAGCAGFSDLELKAFDQAQTVYVATVRKDDNQSTPAPVWFTMSADRAQLLIQAHKGSWKDKRIRRGSPVIVWIGGLNGPAFIGKAEITKDAAVVDKILTDYPKKYTMNALVGPSRASFESGDRIAIRITPIKDLPAGFSSAPGTPAPALQRS
jgi:general stress protein 26